LKIKLTTANNNDCSGKFKQELKDIFKAGNNKPGKISRVYKSN
jgi:hypothetical protein